MKCDPLLRPLMRSTVLTFLFVASACIGTASISYGQVVLPHTTYRLEPSTVYEAKPITVYKLEEETVVEQRPVTRYKTESLTEMRERRYRVAKPVKETSERVQRYKVMKPVTETSYRNESREVTTYKTETNWRKESRTVYKQVPETSEREERRTVFRPVTDYEVKEERHTAYRPVTQRELQWRDRSYSVDVPYAVPGRSRTRLRWVPRTSYSNPLTGLPTSQRAGFYWVPEQEMIGQTQRQYVPNFVPEEVDRVGYVPETVSRKVPVARTRLEEVEERRTVPVTTYRPLAEKQYRYVPETVKKPVVRRETRRVPVTTTRWVEEEVVRKVPVTTYRMQWEERVEKVPVKVERTVPIREFVETERKVQRYVPEVREQVVAKTVMSRVPIADDCCLAPPAFSGSYATSIEDGRVEPATFSYEAQYAPTVEEGFGIPIVDGEAGWTARSDGGITVESNPSSDDNPLKVVPPANQGPIMPQIE